MSTVTRLTKPSRPVERRKNMMWELVDDLLYVIHDTEAIDPDAWRDFLAYVDALPRLDGILVFGPQVKPDAAQRNDVRMIYQRFGTKLAVITHSKVTMGVLSAIRWFGVAARGFRVDQLEQAHVFLGREDMTEVGLRLLAPYLDQPPPP